MSAWGKVIGAAVGLFSGGPMGAVFGLVVGHSIDAGVPRLRQAGDVVRIQSIFFERLFELLGHVAKADGRVSEAEVAAVETLMVRLSLDDRARRRAIECFNRGKRPSFQAAGALRELREVTAGHDQLRRLGLEMIIEMACADGRLKPEGCQVVDTAAWSFEIPAADVEAMLALRAGTAAGPSPYEILGVTPDTTNDAIKKAYRRLMARHHPDKLVSQGLPPEMLELAAERTREIRAAYDQLRRERAF